MLRGIEHHGYGALLMVRQQLAGTSHPGPDLLQRSSQMAVTKFWALLSNFAGLGLVPAEEHPFLEGAEGRARSRVLRIPLLFDLRIV